MPKNMTLLPHQKRQAMETCLKHGIAAHELSWEETAIGNPGLAPQVSRLVHCPTECYFVFDTTPTEYHHDLYSPGENSWTHKDEHQIRNNWDQTFRNVEKWASYLAREIKALSFLEQMQRVPALEHIPSSEADNTPFTLEEQQTIAERLDLIEQRVLAVANVQQEHAGYVREQFRLAREASKRAGRIGWLQMFLGMFFSVVAPSLDPACIQEVWHYVNMQLGCFVPGIPRLG